MSGATPLVRKRPQSACTASALQRQKLLDDRQMLPIPAQPGRSRPQSAKLRRSVVNPASERLEDVPTPRQNSKWREMLHRSPDFRQSRLQRLENETYELLRYALGDRRRRGDEESRLKRRHRGKQQNDEQGEMQKNSSRMNHEQVACGSGAQVVLTKRINNTKDHRKQNSTPREDVKTSHMLNTHDRSSSEEDRRTLREKTRVRGLSAKNLAMNKRTKVALETSANGTRARDSIMTEFGRRTAERSNWTTRASFAVLENERDHEKIDVGARPLDDYLLAVTDPEKLSGKNIRHTPKTNRARKARKKTNANAFAPNPSSCPPDRLEIQLTNVAKMSVPIKDVPMKTKSRCSREQIARPRNQLPNYDCTDPKQEETTQIEKSKANTRAELQPLKFETSHQTVDVGAVSAPPIADEMIGSKVQNLQWQMETTESKEETSELYPDTSESCDKKDIHQALDEDMDLCLRVSTKEARILHEIIDHHGSHSQNKTDQRTSAEVDICLMPQRELAKVSAARLDSDGEILNNSAVTTCAFQEPSDVSASKCVSDIEFHETLNQPFNNDSAIVIDLRQEDMPLIKEITVISSTQGIEPNSDLRGESNTLGYDDDFLSTPVLFGDAPICITPSMFSGEQHSEVTMPMLTPCSFPTADVISAGFKSSTELKPDEVNQSKDKFGEAGDENQENIPLLIRPDEDSTFNNDIQTGINSNVGLESIVPNSFLESETQAKLPELPAEGVDFPEEIGALEPVSNQCKLLKADREYTHSVENSLLRMHTPQSCAEELSGETASRTLERNGIFPEQLVCAVMGSDECYDQNSLHSAEAVTSNLPISNETGNTELESTSLVCLPSANATDAEDQEADRLRIVSLLHTEMLDNAETTSALTDLSPSAPSDLFVTTNDNVEDRQEANHSSPQVEHHKCPSQLDFVNTDSSYEKAVIVEFDIPRLQCKDYDVIHERVATALEVEHHTMSHLVLHERSNVGEMIPTVIPDQKGAFVAALTFRSAIDSTEVICEDECVKDLVVQSSSEEADPLTSWTAYAIRIQRQFRCFSVRRLIMDQLHFFLSSQRRQARKKAKRESLLEPCGKGGCIDSKLDQDSTEHCGLKTVTDVQLLAEPQTADVETSNQAGTSDDTKDSCIRENESQDVIGKKEAHRVMLELAFATADETVTQANTTPSTPAAYNILSNCDTHEKPEVSAVTQNYGPLEGTDTISLLCMEDTVHQPPFDGSADEDIVSTFIIDTVSPINEGDLLPPTAMAVSLELNTVTDINLLARPSNSCHDESILQEESPVSLIVDANLMIDHDIGCHDEPMLQEINPISVFSNTIDKAEESSADELAHENLVHSSADIGAPNIVNSGEHWERYMDDANNKSFYYNRETGESQWVAPEDGFIADITLDDGKSVAVEDTEYDLNELVNSNVTICDNDDDRAEHIVDKSTPSQQAQSESSQLVDQRRVWQEFVDQVSLETYYYNSVTGECSWTAPQVGDEVCSQAEANENDDDWAMYIDPSSGAPYYVNLKTNETAWEKPSAAAGDSEVLPTTLDLCALALEGDFEEEEQTEMSWAAIAGVSSTQSNSVPIKTSLSVGAETPYEDEYVIDFNADANGTDET